MKRRIVNSDCKLGSEIRVILAQVILLFSVPALQAQSTDTLFVSPIDNTGESFGVLNKIIAGDTLPDGQRTNLKRVYQLQRGATYILNGSISHAGFTLTLAAQKGSGPRPRLVPGVVSGNLSAPPFEPKANLTLNGIYVTNENELGGLTQRMIRVQADNVRIEIDGCHLDRDGQSAIRLDNVGAKVYIRNSIISRMGTPNNTDNGRVVDDRGNRIDTLIMENNTIYNITSRVVRDGDGGESYIKFCRFNNNTVMNVAQRAIDFGPVVDMEMKNNIIVNPAFLGTGVDPIPGTTVPDPNDQPDPAILIEPVTQSILDALGMQQNVVISHNNIYTNAELLAARPVVDPDPTDDDVIVSRPVWSAEALAFIDAAGTAATNIEEVITFAKSPPLPIAYVQQWWISSISADDWLNTGAPFDFRYINTFQSATASSISGQLGDLNWKLIFIGIDGLNEAIAELMHILETIQVGNNIGNYPAEAVEAAELALAAAKIVAEGNTPSPEEIEMALAELSEAKDKLLSSLITSAGFIELSANSVYPNPAIDFVVIPGDTESVRSIQLINAQSKLVYSYQLAQDRLDISTLPMGLYVLVIVDKSGNMTTSKVLKQ